jgi:hypothetical protein
LWNERYNCLAVLRSFNFHALGFDVRGGISERIHHPRPNGWLAELQQRLGEALVPL